MAPSLVLPEPRALLNAATKEEVDLRRRYLQLGSALSRNEQPLAGDLLQRTADLLEMVTVSVCLVEASDEDGAPSLTTPSKESLEYYRARVRQMCGLDLEVVASRATRILDLPKSEEQPANAPSMDAVLRTTRSLLESCPIQYLERLAAELGLEPVGHRCRIAYEALRAFVLRNDEREQGRLKLVGRAYARGGLTPAEVALLLDTDVPDAIAVLERHGYQRSIEVISLSDAERSARLGAIREDRLRRAGRPDYSPDLAVRDAIASERIEGVDARSWLPRDLM